VQRDSAPEVDGNYPTVAVSHPEPAGDDPVRRLLGEPPDPVRQMGLRHWLGIFGLVAAIAAAAFVLPPLITSGAPSAPQTLGAPQWPSAGSASAAVLPPASAATSPSPAAPKTAPTTGGSSGNSRAAAPTSPPAPTAKATTRAAGTTTGRFSAITVQAEASTSTLTDGAVVVDCATCEAGARVRYVGRVDIHTTVSQAGTRHLTIVYETNGTRSFDVSINGGAAVATSVTGTDWTTPKSVTVSASIPAGAVDIGLYGYAGNAPDFDAVTIS